ncbi:MAG TPA: protoporphyrinogen oxidase [Acidimicrobiales bacterium]|jgi:oxygen-dependent protoporphyrinogen oxidase|nr:protoporphyrinogen oxidase [Acidimicrobiales bacterium]
MARTGERVAVVGGGITGLAAAYEATKAGARVTVYEGGARLGGKILTTEFEGVPVDAGPDAFLARVPHAVELCRELGLAGELVAPAAGKAFVWTGGRLRPLPEGLVLGVPTDLFGLARSGILSPAGVLRAGLDLVLPRTRFGDDPSVAEVVTARFGHEAADRLVEPLLGGIHAGRIDRLSLSASAPQLAAAAQRSRSLLLGLRGTGAKGSLDGPVFFSLKGGMARLVEALAERLDDVRLGQPVDGLPDADRVVVATPAPATARLLQAVSPEAGEELREIEHASVALVTLAYESFDGAGSGAGSGFLVPRVDGRLMTACSFGTNKWPHWSGPGRTVLRVSAGRAGDDRAMRMADDELVDGLHAELAEAVGVRSRPVAQRVSRWPDGFPQYAPGHAARVQRIEAAVARDLPRVRLAGAALHGVGIPACIASGRAAVR